MANGCRTFFRVLLGIFTALFLIIGLLMLGFGAGLKADPNGVFNMVAKLSEDAQKVLLNAFGGITDGAAVFMIVLGCITVVISFIGFVGAVSGSTCLLVTYAIIILLLFGAEIALIVIVAGFPEKLAGKISPLSDFTKEDVYVTDTYLGPPSDTNGRAWYIVQNYFDCCGIVSPKDYDPKSGKVTSRKANGNYTQSTKVMYPGLDNLAVPISCCKKKQSSAFFYNTTDLVDFKGCTDGSDTAYNDKGCAARMLASTGPIPIAIAATTLGIELLLIICSIVIACLKDHSKL